jgi:N-methylhydantoinase B/oxoprolinase/acetone carboxylase alpha subunit
VTTVRKSITYANLWLRDIHEEKTTQLAHLDAGKATRPRNKEYIELDRRIAIAKFTLDFDLTEMETQENPNYVEVIMTYLRHVSCLFGHASFINPDIIDANLVEPILNPNDIQL